MELTSIIFYIVNINNPVKTAKCQMQKLLLKKKKRDPENFYDICIETSLQCNSSCRHHTRAVLLTLQDITVFGFFETT